MSVPVHYVHDRLEVVRRDRRIVVQDGDVVIALRQSELRIPGSERVRLLLRSPIGPAPARRQGRPHQLSDRSSRQRSRRRRPAGCRPDRVRNGRLAVLAGDEHRRSVTVLQDMPPVSPLVSAGSDAALPLSANTSNRRGHALRTHPQTSSPGPEIGPAAAWVVEFLPRACPAGTLPNTCGASALVHRSRQHAARCLRSTCLHAHDRRLRLSASRQDPAYFGSSSARRSRPHAVGTTRLSLGKMKSGRNRRPLSNTGDHQGGLIDEQHSGFRTGARVAVHRFCGVAIPSDRRGDEPRGRRDGSGAPEARRGAPDPLADVHGRCAAESASSS